MKNVVSVKFIVFPVIIDIFSLYKYKPLQEIHIISIMKINSYDYNLQFISIELNSWSPSDIKYYLDSIYWFTEGLERDQELC